MTPQEVNRALAEKVMGWTWRKAEDGFPYLFHWVDKEGIAHFPLSAWDPWHRIDHAMMCLENFPVWKMQKMPDCNFECVIGVGRGYKGGAITDKLTSAICGALMQAVKEVDSEKK